MTVLEKFENSNAWHKESGLPLAPDFNNPFIYLAYSVKIIRFPEDASIRPSIVEIATLFAKIKDWIEKCRIRPGLFNRWPNGTGGIFSWDEIMGLAYFSPEIAKELLMYLYVEDGVYCNKPEEMKEGEEEKYNVFRFIFMEPYLRARSQLRVGLINQLKFILHIARDGFQWKPENPQEQGRCQMWLMGEEMKRFPLIKIAYLFWENKMTKNKMTPKLALKGHLEKCPVYAENAPELW